MGGRCLESINGGVSWCAMLLGLVLWGFGEGGESEIR